MNAYYNEIDPFAAEWLRKLIAAGHIAPGDVDERSIVDVRPDDLKGYAQCHFFAGIGGWSYALRLAGWDDARPVWTGSCPCQPFSSAGKQKGEADERHLWPEFQRLITECAPPTIFGEQVASSLGREWLAGVRADLEALGYAVGAADLCAAGVGAPHIRQRLYWMADAGASGRGALQRPAGADKRQAIEPDGHGDALGLGDACGQGLPQRRSDRRVQREAMASYAREAVIGAGFWSNATYLPCTDGKARRIEPGSFPLAHGVPGRVGLLRGYGNAIVPQVAAAFIEAAEGAMTWT